MFDLCWNKRMDADDCTTEVAINHDGAEAIFNIITRNINFIIISSSEKYFHSHALSPRERMVN